MANNIAGKKPQCKGKRILKGLDVALVVLIGFVVFASIEGMMTGSDLNGPSQLLPAVSAGS